MGIVGRWIDGQMDGNNGWRVDGWKVIIWIDGGTEGRMVVGWIEGGMDGWWFSGWMDWWIAV